MRRLARRDAGRDLLLAGLLHVRHQAGHAAFGALPMADITIYYMDIRTFGKGYEQFYQNAKAMGIEFVRGKVALIREDADQNPIVKVEMTETGEIVERTSRPGGAFAGHCPGLRSGPDLQPAARS